MSTTKKRTYSANKCFKIVQSLKSSFRDVYRRAREQFLSQDSINAAMNKVRENIDYAKLRNSDHEYLAGFCDALFHEHWRELVYTYVHNGIRYSIECDEYKQIPPRDIDTNTGAFAYRQNLNALY